MTKAQLRPGGFSFLVTWRNPVSRHAREVPFNTREEAEAYIQGRRDKYGGFAGWREPEIHEFKWKRT